MPKTIDEIWVVTSVATDYSVLVEVYGDEETAVADAEFNRTKENWEKVWVEHIVLSEWVDETSSAMEDEKENA